MRLMPQPNLTLDARRLTPACALLLLLGPLMAGCSSGPRASTAPSPSSSSQVAVASTSAASSAGVSVASSAPRTSVAASSAQTSSARTLVDNCTDSQLTVRRKPAVGGDSNGGIIVVFTNQSGRTCSLDGYPGAANLDRAGHQFEQARRTLTGYIAGCRCSHPTRIRLAAGQSASSVIEGNNGGGTECLRGHSVLVTPPNATHSTRLPYLDAYSCGFQVHPAVAGAGGGNRH